MRILVVDDEATVRELLCVQLGEHGHEVHTARDGYEALRCLGRQHYDAVVSDLQMPGLDGLALSELARQGGYGGAWILMTGAHKHKRLLEVTEKVLLKPFRCTELLQMLASVSPAKASAMLGERSSDARTGVHVKNPLGSAHRTRGNQT